MEGLVLTATAFMSFASLIWLVVAKLATEEEANNPSSNNRPGGPISAVASTLVTTTIFEEDGGLTSAVLPVNNDTTQNPTQASPNPTEKKRMSRRQLRRQRKNAKKSSRESEASPTSIAGSIPELCPGINNNSTKNAKKRSSLPSKIHTSLGLTDDQIYHHLLNYILDHDNLRSLGFPLESQLSPGKAWVYLDPDVRGKSNFVFDDLDPVKTSGLTSGLDANAREFIPKGQLLEEESAASGDDVASTHSSNSLSASAKEFVPSKFCEMSSAKFSSNSEEEFYEGRNCARCNKLYYVFKDTGESVHQEECVYHWGKARSSRKYSCCGRRIKSGCETASSHVWRGCLYEVSGQHKDLDGFAKTRVPRNRALPSDGNFGVFGLDGEMLFTTQGLQLCKMTVVGIDGRLVYETIIRPDDPIVDYNTRFSGVTARDLKRGPVKSLKEVQNDLLGFINANTILIGHGLENDLRSLKLVHMTVIDTSLVFPHYYGMPFRRSLKSIVQSYLQREIQAEKGGHDSYEDARACVELMLWKVQQDFCSSPTSTSGSSLINTSTTSSTSSTTASSLTAATLSGSPPTGSTPPQYSTSASFSVPASSF